MVTATVLSTELPTVLSRKLPTLLSKELLGPAAAAAAAGTCCCWLLMPDALGSCGIVVAVQVRPGRQASAANLGLDLKAL